jgi:hypothetical protein
MKIPKGFELDQGDSADYVPQLHNNVYGQKQAGRGMEQTSGEEASQRTKICPVKN